MGFIPENVIVNLKKEIAASGGAAIEALTTRVQTLENTVGDETGGLVKDVDDLETVVGDSSGGLVKDVTNLYPTSYSMPTVSEGVSALGGYCKVGNLVCLNMRLANNGVSEVNVSISDLPKYNALSQSNIVLIYVVNVSSGVSGYSYILYNGTTGSIAVPAGANLVLLSTYLSIESVTRDTESNSDNEDLK